MIVGDFSTQLEQFLENRPFHAVFFLAHPHIDQRMKVIEELKYQKGWVTISISNLLAQVLQEIPINKRSRQVPQLIASIVHANMPDPVICTDIDLLFDPSLRLDPLSILLNISKQTTLIVAWPGSYQEGILTYAVPEHAHYRTWRSSTICDYCVVKLP